MVFWQVIERFVIFFMACGTLFLLVGLLVVLMVVIGGVDESVYR